VRGSPPVEVWTSDHYLADFPLANWDKPFIRSAQAMVKSGWAMKNIVPNVSAAVFRHPGAMPLLNDPDWLALRMCGDWVFYLAIIRGGLVAYTPLATNCYRQHPLNTSVNAQKEEFYYKEHEVVAKYIAKLYAVDRSDLEKQEHYLYQHWCQRRGNAFRSEFNALYDIDRIWPLALVRKPNIVMAVYALAAGGGETFPVMLANLLHERGYAVTVLNCKQQPTEPGVLGMLRHSIPLLELEQLSRVATVFTDMGIELVHSHHAWVDLTLATNLIHSRHVRQVVTMHGMYEMMTSAQLASLMPLLHSQIDRFVFTAEKALLPFTVDFIKEKKFCKINNALVQTKITPVGRAELDIGEDDFVLCLVARAIPEKGWSEAIDAVCWANECIVDPHNRTIV